MKKAYVKPVFLAEEFVAAASVATCPYKPNSAVNQALDLTEYMSNNTKICTNTSNGDGHTIMGSGVLRDESIKAYAKGSVTGDSATISNSNGDGFFSLFDTANIVCDFVWLKPSSGEDKVQVWGNDNQLVADHSQRSTLMDWIVKGKNWSKGFMWFFAGCNATEKNHGLNYEVFDFNS